MLFLAGCSQRVFVQAFPVPAAPPAPPHVQVDVSSARIQPGHALRVKTLTNVSELRVRLQGWDQDVDLLPSPEDPCRYEGYLAVPLNAQPGPAALTVNAMAVDRQPLVAHAQVEVIPRAPDQTTWLRIKNFEKLDYSPESSRVFRTRVSAEPSKDAGFKGALPADFIWPVNGVITEPFGSKRIYNDGISSWVHGGLDIAAPGGTPIKAPADGIVVLAAAFTAHGNTVLIDHGYGVVTTFLHQRRIYVQEGERVTRGQPIGEVGKTGGATGNHLHFQINIHGRIVDPLDFLMPQTEAAGEISSDAFGTPPLRLAADSQKKHALEAFSLLLSPGYDSLIGCEQFNSDAGVDEMLPNWL